MHIGYSRARLTIYLISTINVSYLKMHAFGLMIEYVAIATYIYVAYGYSYRLAVTSYMHDLKV